MKTIIMAGGKGTRISSLFSDIPKPMIEIESKPVLEHEIECLRDQGFTDIIITVSYMGEVIMDYFGDGTKISKATGKPFGVNIEYFFEKEPLGNAGALFKLKDKLTEDFLLLNADSIFDIDFNRFVEYHKNHKGLATILTHPNTHPYDSGIIITDTNDTVLQWLTKEDERPEFYKNNVNAGMHILSPKLLEIEIDSAKIDLDRQILKPLAGTGNLISYSSPEFVMDMGTPDRYNKVIKDFKNNLPKLRNLNVKQKAIFLDRDGTINEHIGFLSDINDFKLLPDVTTAIKIMNDLGYITIVVTNQPVIARGEVSEEELDLIHNKMETLLGLEGVYVNDIFYCPHHTDKGFEGERPELKFDCGCRKPKPGMLMEAAIKYNLDLSQCFMIGDSKSDIVAGKNAGCKTALIGTEDFGQDITVKSLLEFIEGVK